MNIATSANINYLWSLLIVEELTRQGIDYFCVAPGSRSSPLAMAVGFNPKATSFVHFDERSLAYHALGFVSATQKPCVLICTSGTAVANMFPAVIEASKKKLPLIVLTADRPPELRMTGANQTIDQVKIFGDYVKFFFDIPTPTEDIKPEFVLTTVSQAAYRAKSNPSGPVHLNIMFREPLAPIKTKLRSENYLKNITAWMDDRFPFTTYSMPHPGLNEYDLDQVAAKVNATKNGIIVCGKLASKEDREAILKLSEKLSWPVFADISSGLRLGKAHKNVISYYDQILLCDYFSKGLQLDGVLHFGGRLTSTRYYDYIDHHRPKAYIMTIYHPLRNDPSHVVSMRLHNKPHVVAQALIEKVVLRKSNSLLSTLQRANQSVEETITHFFETQNELFDSPHEITEPEIARLITQNISADHALFLASSLPIREIDIYGDPNKNSVTIGANRGTSGIDGTISSAHGFSVGLKKASTVLIGDLAFLYDLNALAMVKDSPYPLVIVILNNNGGGIFSFLPIAQSNKSFEKFFGTPHNLSFQKAAEMFDLNYAQPKSKTEFIDQYLKAVKAKKSTIIEVETNREQNVKVHHSLQKKIAVTLSEKLEK